MKTLIPILFVIILLTSCEKKQNCWKCEFLSHATQKVTTKEYCDMTQDDISKLQSEMELKDEGYASSCTPL